MVLGGHYPGPPRILDHMGFTVDISRAAEVAQPSDHELRILRDVCDPQRLILG